MTTPYQRLLRENAEIMRQRIEQAQNPDVSVFNVAKEGHPRLAVFEQIISSAKKEKKSKKSKTSQKSKKPAAKKAENTKA